MIKIPMNFKDGTGNRKMRPEYKGKSTMDLIKTGERTATSRDISKYYNKHTINVGDIVCFYNKVGEEILVRCKTKQYPIFEISREEWSKLECWEENQYDILLQKGNYYQFQFELIK